MIIGIIGATGLCGMAMIKSLEMLNVISENDELRLYASDKKSVMYKGNYKNVDKFEYEILCELDYVLLAVENELSRDIVKYVRENKLDVCVIDSSSEFRMDDNVPLIVPEVNIDSLPHDCKLVANPNCSTTFLAMLLKALEPCGDIKKVVVSTYQAASGAGIKGLDELQQQMIDLVDSKPITCKFWKKQYVANVFSHNSKMDMATKHNEEEMKMINETKKILGKEIKISPTCVRVPTYKSHCESVHVIFNKDVTYEDIIMVLSKYSGIKILDNLEANQFPEPCITSGKTDLYVGRIRADIDDESCWNFFISCDQTMKGAGYNSVQILNHMMHTKK